MDWCLCYVSGRQCGLTVGIRGAWAQVQVMLLTSCMIFSSFHFFVCKSSSDDNNVMSYYQYEISDMKFLLLCFNM